MTNGKLDGATEEVRETLMAQFRRIARLHRKRARDRADKMDGDAQSIRDLDRFDHMPDTLRDVHAMDRGDRPNPSTYFTPEDLQDHVSRFDGGATRFVRREDYENHPISRDDGTTFVMSTAEILDLEERTGGDRDLMAAELGLAPGFFDGDIMRIDIPNPHAVNTRMPSGNEDGANQWWLPGGTLPGGLSEAVIDAGSLDPSDYTVSPYRIGG